MKKNKFKGRAKQYVKCWNCEGYVQKKLLDGDHYDGACPLCEATGLADEVN